MLQRVLHKSKIITLLCYCVYALSPIYAAFPASISGSRQEDAAQNHVEFGILWLNIVLDSFVDDDGTNTIARGGQYLQAPQDEDKEIVLITKKRAVNKKYYLEQPFLQTIAFVAQETEAPLPNLCAYEIPRDLIHRHAKGYNFLSTGLSPPSFPS